MYNELVKNFPKQKIKEGSCLNAFSKGRMLIGLKKKRGKKKGKKKKKKK